MGNVIEVYIQKGDYKKKAAEAKRYIEKILLYYGMKNAHIAVFFISSQKMRALNRRFRGKDRATNVLTFVEPDDFISGESEKYLGEIYINLEYIEKHKQSLAHMIVHGFLHTKGYDHRNNKEEKEMVREEERLLTNIA